MLVELIVEAFKTNTCGAIELKVLILGWVTAVGWLLVNRYIKKSV